MLLGFNIQTQRNLAGMTVEELAQRAGVDEATVTAWEENKQIPTVEELKAVAEALNVSMDELCRLPKEPRKKKERTLNPGVYISMILLFIFTLISIPLALVILGVSVALSPLPQFPNTLIEYTWTFFLPAPLIILSIVYGIRLQRKKYKTLKNVIAGLIILPMLLVYGCFCFMFAGSTSHKEEYLTEIIAETGMEIPTDIDAISTDTMRDAPTLTMVKLTKDANVEFLAKEEYFAADGLWKTQGVLDNSKADAYYKAFLSGYKYFAVYNAKTDSFSGFEGEHYLFAYNPEERIVVILHYPEEATTENA